MRRKAFRAFLYGGVLGATLLSGVPVLAWSLFASRAGDALAGPAATLRFTFARSDGMASGVYSVQSLLSTRIWISPPFDAPVTASSLELPAWALIPSDRPVERAELGGVAWEVGVTSVAVGWPWRWLVARERDYELNGGLRQLREMVIELRVLGQVIVVPAEVQVFPLLATAAVGFAAGGAAVWLLSALSRARRRRRGLCGDCGYPSPAAGQCPECGSSITDGAP